MSGECVVFKRMRITLSELRSVIREEIRRSCLLTEAACPVCGTDGAYIGLHKVECVNPSCRHFVEPPAPADDNVEGLPGGWPPWGEVRKIVYLTAARDKNAEVEFMSLMKAMRAVGENFLVDMVIQYMTDACRSDDDDQKEGADTDHYTGLVLDEIEGFYTDVLGMPTD